MKPAAQLTLGLVAAVALLTAAVWLWLHNVIIVAAPVGFLAVGCAWAGVDNAVIYPKERARRQQADGSEPAATDVPASPGPDTREVTVPH